MFRPTGYFIPSGYVGFLPNGRKMFFASESDYDEYISEISDDREV